MRVEVDVEELSLLDQPPEPVGLKEPLPLLLHLPLWLSKVSDKGPGDLKPN